MKKIKNKELRDIQVQMLRQLTDFLDKIDVKYSIWSGTMLGAIRHKGFIPWDDDIDIAIRRDDYNKLENYLLNNKYVSNEYRFYLPTVDKDRTDIIAFLNKNVFYYDNSKYHTKRNLWIDIFPIDGLPNNKIYRKLYLFNLKTILHRLVLIKFEDKYEIGLFSGSTLKKILFKFFSFIMKPISFEKIRMLFLKYAAKIDCNKSKELTNYVCGIFEKEAFPAELFDEFIDVKFENIEVKCIKKYDKWLTIRYGDYMKLPPVDQRITHGVIFYKK